MDSKPTTVRGWLETLPTESMRNGLADKAIIAGISEMPCNSLVDAVWKIWSYSREGYYLGIHDYLDGCEPNNTSGHERYEDGYNAAKAAFETPKISIAATEQPFSMSLKASTDGEHFVEVTPTYEVREIYTYQQYEGFALVAPERLAELERKEKELEEKLPKANAWDTFSPKFRYLMNFFTDLEGLKP